MRARLILSSLALALMTLSAQAAPPKKIAVPTPTVADIKPLQDWQAKTKAHLDYIGTRYGLDMWIATRDSSLQLVYTTADHQAMLLEGTLLGPNGENLTTELQSEFVAAHPDQAEAMLKNVSQNNPALKNTPFGAASPAPNSGQTSAATPAAPAAAPTAPASRSENLWQDLSTAKTISFGADTAPTVYMIADLTCDHCKDLWIKLSPAVAASSLHLQILPIAILGKTSQDAAASVLSQSNPADAWLDHIKGGKNDAPATAEGIAALAANQALAKKYKLLSTPTLIYRDHVTNAVKLVFGNPNDMIGIWTDMGLQPATAEGIPAPAPNAGAAKP